MLLNLDIHIWDVLEFCIKQPIPTTLHHVVSKSTFVNIQYAHESRIQCIHVSQSKVSIVAMQSHFSFVKI